MQKLICVCWLLLLAPASVAAEANPLQRFLAEVQTLRAEFTQELYDETGLLLESGGGDLAIQRPGKFRWTYREPYQQLIVADGERIWIYEEDLQQVTVKSQADIGNTPAMLLSNRLDLERNFNAETLPTEDGQARLLLHPKDPDAQFLSMLLRFQDGTLSGLELRDKLGQLTRLQFLAVETNPALATDLFSFTPPAGVDVIDGSS